MLGLVSSIEDVPSLLPWCVLMMLSILVYLELQTLGAQREKQIALAVKFGYDIVRLNRRESFAVIDGLKTELNHEMIKSKGLAHELIEYY